jgi:hypothetical protein
MPRRPPPYVRRVRPGRHPYPDPADPSVYRVPLTRGRYALIDAADAPSVGQFMWSALRGGRPLSEGGAAARGRTKDDPPSPQFIALAHHILRPPPGTVVGFANDDPLDCRKCNLLVLSRSQSNRRSRKVGGRSSPFRGVSYEASRGKWRAHLKVDGKVRQIGRFRDPVRAALAYDEQARLRDGALARLNFALPSESPPTRFRQPEAPVLS